VEPNLSAEEAQGDIKISKDILSIKNIQDNLLYTGFWALTTAVMTTFTAGRGWVLLIFYNNLARAVM